MKVAKYRRRAIFAFVAVLLFMPIGVTEGASASQLAVSVTGQTLTAGFNSNVTMTVTYSYFSGNVYPSSAIYDVDVAVSLPTPLQILGNNHWRYDSIALKQSVNMTFQIYAPTSAIGNSYQGTITVNYRELGDISYTEETSQVTFAVRGWINLVLYGVQVTSSAAVPGGNATISGNILNSGNLAAYNANVSVKSDALAPTSTSSLFIGEIDTNIARPFSLLVSFKKNLAEGNYSITVKLTAIDTDMPASPYSVERTSRIQIRRPIERPTITPPQEASGLTGMMLEILRILFRLFFGSETLPTFPFELSTAFSESPYAFGLK